MEQKPPKKIYPVEEQRRILDAATVYIRGRLLPDSRVDKILIDGSLASWQFGEYDRPLPEKYGSGRHSDIDCVAIVDEGYAPNPEWKEVARRLFWEVYELGVLEGKYPVQCLFVKKSALQNKEAVEQGEAYGVPMKLESSKNQYVLIYDREGQPAASNKTLI